MKKKEIVAIGTAGLEMYRRKRFQAAEQTYRRALERNPGDIKARHLLGILKFDQKKYYESCYWLIECLAIDSQNAHIHNDLGNAYRALNQFEAALNSYQNSIILNSRYWQAHFNKAQILRKQGKLLQAYEALHSAELAGVEKFEIVAMKGELLLALNEPLEAIKNFKAALRFTPNDARIYSQCGEAFHLSGDLAKAVDSYKYAIKINPNLFEAHSNLGNILHLLGRLDEALEFHNNAVKLKPDLAECWYNLANTLRDLRAYEEAISSLSSAISLRPNFCEAHNNLGNCFEALGRNKEALKCYGSAIDANPNYSDAYFNKAVVLQKEGELRRAVAYYRMAIERNELDVKAHTNLGVVLHSLGNISEAISSYERALELDENYQLARWNKSLSLLLLGLLVSGFQLYESRWDTGMPEFEKRALRSKPWMGERCVSEKTIFVFSEQGLGDTIQFIRYLLLLKGLGMTVVFEASKSLRRVLENFHGIDTFIEKGAPVPFTDYHCSLLSLPNRFNTDLTTIPDAVPYLSVAKNKLSEWSYRLGSPAKPRVGLAWAGRREHSNDHNRSIPLGVFLQYLPEGFEYVSLQKEVSNPEKDLLLDRQIYFFTQDINDFVDTAAICKLIDVVLSVDTSVAHLAGALGSRTWILLPKIPDWRWMLNRTDSPWYPSVRLYRQTEIGLWDSVLKEVSADLLKLYSLGSKLV